VADLDPIPFNDLRRQTAAFQADIDGAIASVIESGYFVLGPNVSAFESEFASYCGIDHCVATANGTDAIELALRALDCGPGKEVVTVANAGMYATSAILSVGASPVLVDIDPDTMTMAPESLAGSIGRQTGAIVVTHLYGQLADLDAIVSIAGNYSVPIIEDCAQAHGAARGGRRAGTVGAIGCFSFYPTKNLGALGDGGAVTTNDSGLYDALLSLRQYGWGEKYCAARPYGRNSRLDEIQAAILRVKLPKLDSLNERRRQIVGRYREAAGSAITVPKISGPDHVAHLCVVRCTDRQALRQFLSDSKISTEIHYPIPDHYQEALQGIFPPNIELSNTDRVSEEILTLPCFPELTEQEILRVCDAIAAFEPSKT
jgi:dTDP-4-amino-4,6-dideoxygalactose transaminase